MIVNLFGRYFLFIMCLLVPYSAIKSARKLQAGAVFPTRWKYFTIAIVTQAVLFGLSLAAAWSNGIPVFALHDFHIKDLLVCLAGLGVGLCCLLYRWRTAPAEKLLRMYRLVPHDRREYVYYLAVCLAAGVSEELTYRGVTFTLLGRLVGGWWAPALICAAVFAVAHAIQGWKSGVVIFFFALGFHVIVLLTGTLYVAMAIHFLYDAIAGVVYGLLSRERHTGGEMTESVA